MRQWAEEYLAARIAKGRMSEEKVEGIKARFHVVETMEEAVKDADLVIEAVVERVDVKHAVMQQVGQLVREDTIIATNSSRMVSSVFVEDVPNPSDETTKPMYDFSVATGKTPIIVNKEINGFVVNRILAAIYQESRSLVEQGYCTYEDLDIACENGLGHPMGPFRLNDLTGIDLT